MQEEALFESVECDVALTAFEDLLIKGDSAKILSALVDDCAKISLRPLESIYYLGEDIERMFGLPLKSLRRDSKFDYLATLCNDYPNQPVDQLKDIVDQLKKTYSMSCHCCLDLLSSFIEQIEGLATNEQSRNVYCFEYSSFPRFKERLLLFFSEKAISDEIREYDGKLCLNDVIEILQIIRDKMICRVKAFMAEDLNGYF
jgi:hypothetical protein